MYVRTSLKTPPFTLGLSRVIRQLLNIPKPRADILTDDSSARRSSMSRLNKELRRDSAG